MIEYDGIMEVMVNKNQILIVDLLSAAIRNKKIENFKNNNYEWDKIYEEAKAQDIHALILPVLKELNTDRIINKEIMQKWQKNALSSGMWQLQLMKEVQNIFVKFYEQGIPAIALKGIVLRELYPFPELRSMGDADILVHPEDIEKAKIILTEMGYREGEANPEHIDFVNKNNNEIELHWSLIGEGRFKNSVNLVEEVWERAIEITGMGIPVLAMHQEDHLLYLGLHMAKHMINAGFGLRQVCDFVLLYETIKTSNDWNSFFEKLKKFGVERFFVILFYVCEELFSIELPDVRGVKSFKGKKYVNLLIQEIFEGGVYGYKNSSRTMGSYVLRNVKQEKSNWILNRFQFIKLLLFPPIKQMNIKYSYAVKYSALKPLAWIHRLTANIFRKDFSVSDKIYFPRFYNKRAKLLSWLDIR